MPEDKKNSFETPLTEKIKTPESPDLNTRENEKQVEQSFESQEKQEDNVGLESIEGDKNEIGRIKANSQNTTRKNLDIKKIEDILSEDLDDFYLKMDSKRKSQFRKVGEETAKKINDLTKEANIKVAKIIALIKKWLTIIPGVNKFFIEQEAKIKTDKILKTKQNNHEL